MRGISNVIRPKSPPFFCAKAAKLCPRRRETRDFLNMPAENYTLTVSRPTL